MIRILFGLMVLVCVFGVPQKGQVRPELSSKRINDWEFVGSGKWTLADGKLILSGPGTPDGPIRKPAALAILKSQDFKSITFDVELKCNAPLETIRRDLDLVFGYQSPTRFYYVHLSAVTDDVHNGIFIVADADRKRIDSGKSEARLKDQNWHHARVVRDVSSGSISVYLDDLKTPLMTAIDTTLSSGRVGVGSFDDVGEFQTIVITP